MLKENNNTIEQVLVSRRDYMDTKRVAVPRLYFLSDTEMITMLGTSDFNVMNEHVSKAFMFVSALDSRAQDLKETTSAAQAQNFQRVRISGLFAKNGDYLPFTRPIQCLGHFENWLGQVFGAMKMSMRDAVGSGLAAHRKLHPILNMLPITENS